MKRYFSLVLIILLLVGNVIYWGYQKEGFHVDEMFSYEQIGNTEYPKPHYDRPDEPCMNTWHSREYYEDYLTVSDGEAFDIAAFYNSASMNGAHPPLYLMLLGMTVSAVSPNRFTKWSGMTLNILLYVLSLLIIYDLAKRVLKKENLALLIVFLTGICVGIVSIAIFIRPYMLLTFFTVAFADIHISMLVKQLRDSGGKRILYYVVVGLIFIGGALSQYYFLVFAFFICLGYWIILLLTKEIRLLLEYSLLLVVSLCAYIYLYPKALRDLFSGERGVEAVSNFMGAEQRYATEFVHYLRELDLQTTGGFFTLIILAVIVAFIIRKIKKYSPSFMLDGKEGIYIKFTVTGKPPVSAGVKTTMIHIEWIIVGLLLFTVISYVAIISKVAPTLPGEPYKTTRYIACIYPCVVLLFVFLIEKVFLRFYKARIWRRIIWLVMILMVLAGYLTCGVKYIFPGTQAQLKRLSSFSKDRAVLVTERTYHSSNLNVYFTKHDAVYQTDFFGLSQISKAFEEGNDNEIIVYISEETENAQQVLNIIMQELKAKSCAYLFLTTGSNRSDVYVIKL